MRTALRLLTAVLCLAAPLLARAADTEIKVATRTLDRQDKLSRPKQDAEELIRGLRITVKNASPKPQAEGQIDWSILVHRPGMQKGLISTGREKLKALQIGETATFEVGSVPVQETNSDRQEMDYRVAVNRAGAPAVTVESTAEFDRLAKEARPMEPTGKKKGKKSKN